MNRKPKSYYEATAWLFVFKILIQSGKELMKVEGETTIDLDVKKQDIYKAEKKIKKFVKHIDSFNGKVNKRVKTKVALIIEDIIRATMRLENISPEIIATHLLYDYFIVHKQSHLSDDFSYFLNENNYYPILDRIENSKLVDNNKIYLLVDRIVLRHM